MREPLESAIHAFLTERRLLAYSASTRAFGAQVMRLLLLAVKARLPRLPQPSAADVVRDDIVSVVDSFRARGLSRQTVFSAAVVLKLFCRRLVSRGVLLLDPSRDVVVPSPVRRLGYVPSPEHVARLLFAAEPERVLLRQGHLPPEDDAPQAVNADYGRRRALALRDLAILELLYGSGLRIGEAIRLDVADLDLNQRTAFIERGKWGKDRVVPITKASAAALARYLDERSALLAFGRGPRPAVFLTLRGRRIEPCFWVSSCLVPLLKAAGLPRALTPHRLRHACAVHLLDGGADIALIARLLGHVYLDTTTIYLALTTASLDRALLRAHPREREEERRSLK